MNLLLITYDIEDDKLRDKIAKKLLEFGMARIQLSVFMGSMKDSVHDKLLQWIQKKCVPLPGKDDQVLLLPLTPNLIENCQVWGASKLDRDDLLGRKHTLIL